MIFKILIFILVGIGIFTIIEYKQLLGNIFLGYNLDYNINNTILDNIHIIIYYLYSGIMEEFLKIGIISFVILIFYLTSQKIKKIDIIKYMYIFGLITTLSFIGIENIIYYENNSVGGLGNTSILEGIYVPQITEEDKILIKKEVLGDSTLIPNIGAIFFNRTFFSSIQHLTFTFILLHIIYLFIIKYFSEKYFIIYLSLGFFIHGISNLLITFDLFGIFIIWHILSIIILLIIYDQITTYISTNKKESYTY